MKLSIIIPCHNEEENISEVISRIEAAADMPRELVVVDDHSADKSAEIIRELSSRYGNIRLVQNRGEKGFANAIRAGFAAAEGEAVVPVMADLCDDLATLGRMWEKICQGYDVVCASRYIQGGRRLGGSRVKGFFSAFVGWSLKFILGIPTHDIANAFKMYRKAVLDKISLEATGFEVSMEIPIKAYFLGARVTEVPSVWKERTRGKSNFKMLRLLPHYLKFYLWAVKEKLKRCLSFR